ncbi:unnamed protein product, partial [Rotaria sp. Silwood1]
SIPVLVFQARDDLLFHAKSIEPVKLGESLCYFD